MEHLLVLPVDQGQLEPELSWVDVEDARLALSVEAEHLGALDPGQVDRQIQGSDDSMITVVDRILYVVASSVDENSTVIPSTGLHPGILMNAAEGLQLSGADGDDMLAQ